MKRFEIGRFYSCQSACDHNCTWIYEIMNKTKNFIWIKDNNDTIHKRKIIISDNCEKIFPLGKYSMAPLLSANDEVIKEEEFEIKLNLEKEVIQCD